MRSLFTTVTVAALVALLSSAIVWNIAPRWHSQSQENMQTSTGGLQTGDAWIPMDTESDSQEASVVEAIHAAEPAVVSVIAKKDLPVYDEAYESVPFFGGTLRIPLREQRGTELRQIGGGTAFFVSSDGLLLTNKHVISDPDAIYSVLLNDGRTFDAQVVAEHPANDIAILRVDGADFAQLSFADTEPQLGQTAIAIGNALGEYANTASVGVVSGLRRSVVAGAGIGNPVERLDRILQTDAAINRGNSGGPLLSIRGEVIGMNSAVALNAENVGFAIPAADLRRAVESYQKNGRIEQAYIGVRYMPLGEEVAERYGMSIQQGALLVSGESGAQAVLPDSPAAVAGLQEGDVIVAIDGRDITIDFTLAAAVAEHEPGDVIRIRFLREEEYRDVDLTLGSLSSPVQP